MNALPSNFCVLLGKKYNDNMPRIWNDYETVINEYANMEYLLFQIGFCYAFSFVRGISEQGLSYLTDE